MGIFSTLLILRRVKEVGLVLPFSIRVILGFSMFTNEARSSQGCGYNLCDKKCLEYINHFIDFSLRYNGNINKNTLNEKVQRQI